MSMLSKSEQKRVAAYMERRQRLINDGTPADKVDEVIAQKDWEALPLEMKFKRLQSTVGNFMKQMANDINTLRHNDGILADAMDVNFAGIARCLEATGLPLEKQREILQKVEEEIRASRQAQAAPKEEPKQMTEAEAADTLLKEFGQVSLTGSEAPPAETALPEGATAFGG